MSLGFSELIDQIPQVIGEDVAEIWHTGSSGGTTSGFGWASDRTGYPTPIVALCISEPAESLVERITRIWSSGVEAFGGEMPQPPLECIDRYLTGGYAQVTDELVEVQAEATRLTGLLFDPTYTGKAIYGLRMEIAKGRFGPDDHVVFWHPEAASGRWSVSDPPHSTAAGQVTRLTGGRLEPTRTPRGHFREEAA